MEPHDTPTTQDKQVTVAVPEDRVAEFYAFYGRFLAAGSWSRRGRRGGHRSGPHHHGRCGHRHEEGHDVTERRPTAPEATEA